MVGSWIDDLGFKSITIRTDGESSIASLMRAVRQCREDGSHRMIEHPPPGDSQANGAAERAVGEVKGLIRTLRSALDKSLGCELPEAHPVFAFLIEHAGVLLSKHKVWANGKTSFEYLKGRKCSTPSCTFGERVMYLPARTAEDRTWNFGAYVGMRRKTNEHLVAGEDGVVVRARALRRVRPSERWNKDLLDRILGTPWAPVDGAREQPVPVSVPNRRLQVEWKYPPYQRYRQTQPDKCAEGASLVKPT